MEVEKLGSDCDDLTLVAGVCLSGVGYVLVQVMDADAERQLKEQKKMQLLEQRIRDAARAQLKSGES